MRRLLLILTACLCSMAIEFAAAGLCPVPQTDLFIGTLINSKLQRAERIGDRPKLVIMAGSNGLFSHRCEVMERVVGLPCVNAGVAVGVGLDYLFARWRPVLHPGDVVYMPMEPPQFVRSRAANRVGPETRLMVRGQWNVLAQLAPDRQLATILSVDLPTEVRDLITEPPLAERMHNIDLVQRRDFNAWGDRVGHTEAEAAGAKGELDGPVDPEPSAEAIEDGYGSGLIAGFVRWASAHGVTVIGGLSTGFADVPLPESSVAAMRRVYESDGGRFLLLANRSRYPRHDFFDTRHHLDEPCQVRHSILVADALAPMLGRTPQPPPAWAEAMRCPGVAPGGAVAASSPAG